MPSSLHASSCRLLQTSVPDVNLLDTTCMGNNAQMPMTGTKATHALVLRCLLNCAFGFEVTPFRVAELATYNHVCPEAQVAVGIISQREGYRTRVLPGFGFTAGCGYFRQWPLAWARRTSF